MALVTVVPEREELGLNQSNADTTLLPKRPTMGMRASELNHGAMKEAWSDVGYAEQSNLIHGLKGSGADILVPDTIAHLQVSCGVHA